MRRAVTAVICSALLLSVLVVPVYAAAIGNLTAAISSDKHVTVSGSVASGSGREVTVRIVDPTGSIEYANSALSGPSGHFVFSYLMTNDAEGEYVVTVNVAGAAGPVTTFFSYGAKTAEATITVYAAMDDDREVVVRGALSSGPGKQVSVIVRAPDGRVAYAGTTISGEWGTYGLSFLLEDSVGGRYTVSVGAAGIALPVSTHFDFVVDTGLKALAVSGAVLSPEFQTGTIAYTVTLGSAVESVIVTPTANDASATIEVNGKVVPSGAPSGAVRLAMGDNAISVVVTGLDGVTSRTYGVTVSRLQASLQVTAELLKHKRVSVRGVVSAGAGQPVTVKITDPNGSVEYLDSVLSEAGGAFGLTYTLENTARGCYRVTAGATELPNVSEAYFCYDPSNANLKDLKVDGTTLWSFSPDKTDYSIGWSGSGLALTPTTEDPDATVSVAGKPVESGQPSQLIGLHEGNNSISVVVTAQDGTTKTYLVDVFMVQVSPPLSGDAALSNLVPSSGVFIDPDHFSPDITFYVIEVCGFTPSITIAPTANDPNAGITVNGAGVASGSPSGDLDLGPDETTITIVVTAQDGTQKTYTVMVRQYFVSPPLSGDADLSNLVPSSGVFLDPDHFSPDVTFYVIEVDGFTPSMTITPTANDPNAGITVNGVDVASGSPSGDLELGPDETTITIVVTAQDETQKMYTVIVRQYFGS